MEVAQKLAESLMSNIASRFATILLGLCFGSACLRVANADIALPGSQPTSADNALATIHVRPGFRAELMAAEPIVIDPVAFDWGPDGKLWVVEMGDYPLGLDGAWKPGGKGSPGGRVRFLEDTNGDGQYDKSTLFLDGLSMPNGVLPWRKGVLVSAAPEIFYAEDTDGDGKADVRKPLFVGFGEGNPQLRINGLRYGLDGWVYCANGWSNGVVKSVATGQEVNLAGHDVRIRPDEGLIELESGVSQFGRNRDDWDNWFGENNSYPLWHYVLAARYQRRNPHVTPLDPIQQLLLPPNPQVFPKSPQEKRYHTLEQSGRYTSACSAMIYRDSLLFGTNGGGKTKRPEDEIRHAFTCEPFHNVVQHNLVLDDGATFRSERDPAESEQDFFASSDRWCRPVMVRTGPDGALWIADMYRYMIEHPEYLTPEGREELKPFYRLGDDCGRLYRVVSEKRRPRPVRRLDRLNTAELVAALDSPSGWQRDTAQMLLVWRRDAAAKEPLVAILKSSENALARLHALVTLSELGLLEEPAVLAALSDNHALVRRQAVRIGESWLADHSEVANKIVMLALDKNAHVQVAVAQTLGGRKDREIGLVLSYLIKKSHSTDNARQHDPPIKTEIDVNQWLFAAALSSVRKENVSLLLELMVKPQVFDSRQAETLGPIISSALGYGETDAVRRVLTVVAAADRNGAYTPAKLSAVVAISDALERHKSSLAIFTEGDDKTRAALAKLVDFSRTQAHDTKADDSLRSLAAAVLARAPIDREAELDRLAHMLKPDTPEALQLDVVAAISRGSDVRNAGRLLSGWEMASPRVRERMLNALLARDAWLLELFTAIERGDVASAEFDATRRARLLGHKNAAIRERAAKMLGTSIDADRAAVIAKYDAALTGQGDKLRGAQLFAKHCANCHRFAGAGTDVGPDLAAITDKSPKSLLTAILDPNLAVEPRFRLYQALTKDGEAISGVMASETAHSVTLISQDGRRHSLARADLERFQATDKSMMPEGLEKELDVQAAADIIEHLRTGAAK
jgi:putative membrane-bound dehydrogenase-like protein